MPCLRAIQYVPPMVAYSIGKDNKVTKTTEITDEGIRETAGGEIGHIPSAPKGWKAGENSRFDMNSKPEGTSDGGEKKVKGTTPIPTTASTKPPGDNLKEETSKHYPCAQEAIF